ncbi:hypothetical protein SAMN04488127_0710 [Bhargavaea ginsengi]|uniref:Uncharacterized protein n=1 Tax=Bhargavaea ginsengi TaxID=426757 RepID=A0A1H6U8T7_9BACL|nr:hypothetical protein [Bhargavaea ginsengi]SEI88778.1 hypothetical protein SAMN04488127_0710 [Bhargavaea ginsengi]
MNNEEKDEPFDGFVLFVWTDIWESGLGKHSSNKGNHSLTSYLSITPSMGDQFGAAPYLFGGFMIFGLLISLVLSIFSPDTRTITQYEEHEELGDFEEPEPNLTTSGKQLNY